MEGETEIAATLQYQDIRGGSDLQKSYATFCLKSYFI
jgi:hypothetical protein